MTSRLRPYFVLSIVLLLSTIVSIQLGGFQTAWSDWWQLLQGQSSSGGAFILLHIRIPRVLFAAVIGACLGLAGALTQGLFRNPLADPGLLGVSSGAACAVALSIVVFAQLGWQLSPEWRYWTLPMSAFIGGVSVCFMLDRVAKWLTGGAIAGLLLTGIALNALAGSVIGLSTYLASDEQLRNLTFWTLGSLGAGTWWLVMIGVVLLVMTTLCVVPLLNHLNALALGEQVAGHIGINVQQLRRRVITMVALISGFAVAFCGLIGFVGLIAPHLVRTVLGGDQRHVVPLSMLVGACLLVIADTLARNLTIAEIPVGIFTSILGAPFFLFLLLRSRHRL